MIGTFLASLIGTTGAAMVLIRPLLRANEWRRNKVHLIIFFIFLVANIGGSLTPLGDPPLFLGFLHNVPFFWVTTGILGEMLVTAGLVLIVFFLIDTFFYRREENKPETDPKARAPAHRGLAQLLLPDGRHGRGDHVRLAEAVRDPHLQRRQPRRGGPLPELAEGRHHHPDGHPFPEDHRQGPAREERVFLVPHPGSGLPVRGHLHDHHSRRWPS